MAKNWWPNVPRCLTEPKVVIASGIKLASQPPALRKFDEYVFARSRQEDTSRPGKDQTLFIFGKSLDNTIYRTDFMRKIGGFPKLRVPAGLENVLAQITFPTGNVWKVNYDVVSTHLRKSLYDALTRCYWYGTAAKN